MSESDRPRIFSVSQFNQQVQAMLEGKVPLSWIEGEISNLVMPPSGHLYFTLKDDASQVRAAMFRNRSRLLGIKPRNGMLVRIRARPTLYLPRGDYQVLVEHIEEAGLGALQRAFDALKTQLAEEGLFASERKRPVPAFPSSVGIVTSASGAAVHDIITVLKRRAPWVQLVLYPTLVQGRDAAAGIVNAIATANRRAEVDVLIVGRGGGSLEDLWSFNEESVARAIAASEIPVISAVGHETDVTIADFVADLRAATPSAAAERVAPPRDELLARSDHGLRSLLRHMQTKLRDAQAQLTITRQGMVRPDLRLREFRQQLDELEMRGRRAIQTRIAHEKTAADDLARRLRQASPDRATASRSQRVTAVEQRLLRALKDRLARRRLALEAAAARLHTVSPLATLSRGYAIVTDEQGAVLRNARDTETGARVRARLGSGRIDCLVAGVQPTD
jgi:exodeoxyribonuclease VII large subunit